MNIEEDIEIKKYSHRKKELLKKVDELDTRGKEKFEALQKEAKPILGVSKEGDKFLLGFS